MLLICIQHALEFLSVNAWAPIYVLSIEARLGCTRFRRPRANYGI